MSSGRKRTPRDATLTMPADAARAAAARARAAARPAPAAVAALFLVLIAVVPRAVLPWRGVVEDGLAIVRDPDACYHMRRAGRIAQNPASLALFDSYINFPHGARVIWPPLYDLALAGLLRVFPASAKDAGSGEGPEAVHAERSPGAAPGPRAAVALLPPLLFGGAVLAMFLLARRLWPGRLGLAALAAGIPAALPASLPYTALAQLDHHAAEILLCALFLLALSGAAEGVRAGRSPARAALRPGLVLGAALLVQLTLVVLIVIPFLAAALAGKRHRGAVRPAAAAAPAVLPLAGDLELAAWMFGVALLAILPFALVYAAAAAPLRHYQFGLFQPAVLALAAAAAVFARAAAAPTARAPRAALLVAAAAVGALLAARLGAEVAGGAAYVARAFAPWQATIGESRSLFALGVGRGLRDAIAALSWLVLLLPIGWIAFARAARAGDARRALLAAALLLFAPLAVSQARFLPHLSLLVGFAAAASVERVRPPSRLAVGAGALLLALGLWPTVAAWRARDDAAVAFDRARSTLEFLARETPPTSDALRPTESPEYGVLAEWSYGHFIQFHGRRPAVADNFGDHAGDPAKTRAFFLETDEARALAVLDSLRARYVLVGDLAATFHGTIPDRAVVARFVAGSTLDRGARGALRFTPAIVPTVLYRLAWLSGSGAPRGPDGYVPPLSHLRLVAESEQTEPIPGGGSAPYVKLYERVPGARLVLRGLAPGRQGALLASIRSPRGRRFPYTMLLAADEEGTIDIAFPYPTAAGSGDFGADRGASSGGDGDDGGGGNDGGGGSDSGAGGAGRSAAERCAIDLGDTVMEIREISEDAVRGGLEIDVAQRR